MTKEAEYLILKRDNMFLVQYYLYMNIESSLCILGRNNDQRKTTTLQQHISLNILLINYIYFHQTMKTDLVSAYSNLKTDLVSAYSNLENTICFTPKGTVIHVASHVKHEAIIL